MEKYFTKFPTITYDGKLIKNISERVSLQGKTKKIPNIFFTYELKNGLRPDTVAYTYYDDAYFDWLIYLANGITDPYYDWYLYDEEFNAYLEKKYGSIEESERRISHYATNWADDPYHISVAAYNALPETHLRYYTPIFGVKNKVIEYKRREEDWTASTNKIIQLNLTSISGTFVNDELIDIRNVEVVGGAEIVSVGTDFVIIKHVDGFYDPTYTITGLTSGATATISSHDILQTVISDDEFVFWEAKHFYDIEIEKNETNKHIYLLDARFAFETSSELQKQLLNI